MVERKNFPSAENLASELADSICDALNAAIVAKGSASIAFSGGSTPKKLFQSLSKRDDVNWEKVIVTLVDERWVNESSDRANAKLLKDNLLQGGVAKAKFLPLFSGGESPDADAIARTNATLNGATLPLDVAILGMGGDGHTASFFPGGDNLSAALVESGPTIAMQAPGADEPRITLTLPVLLDAKFLALHIEGEGKAETLKKAMGEGAVEDMPIRAVLRQSKTPLQIFWCP